MIKSQIDNSEFRERRAGNPKFALRFFGVGSTKKRAGFTLLETIVALALIVSAISGPFSLATRGIFSAKFARSKLIALNLAQEGIELIRHMRENNVLAGHGWRGLTGPCPASCVRLSDGSYQPDVFFSPNGSTPPLNSGSIIRFDESSDLYNQSSGIPTLFTRVVDISTPAADQMRVVATIAWVETGISRQVRLEEVFYNWR